MHVEHRKHGMVQHRDEHGGYTVQYGTTFFVYRGKCDQRVEPLYHHLCATVRQAAHGGENNTKTVKQWYADTAFIFRGKMHMYPCQITVVGDIVVSKHHPFWKTGRAGGVLHVHHIVSCRECT